MRLRITAVALAGLLLGGIASAQDQSDTHLIAVVMHGPGVAPAFWQSDVFVHNPMDSAITVGFAFFPQGQANSKPTSYPDEATRTIQPHGSVLVQDIVLSMFHQGDMKGALLVDASKSAFPDNPPEEWIVVGCRNYNTGSDPRGTFGHGLSNVMMHLNASATPSYATGARPDDRFRCNMGIGNGSPLEITVHYRVLAANGTVVGEGTKTIPASSIGQWTFASLGIGPQTGPLAAEFWLDPASVTADPCANPEITNNFFAYLSPVDGARSGEGTGDGEIIPAVPTEFPPVMFKCP
ncbi:MAG: hypothetical protein A2Y78_05965 [Acidobacteria bacterium RBG_13_68_16]|nr:MAG: hypothetical protein A2Y78_05965 [Acidobacteria bacterium RBG_13_68_16]